jgi:lysophospholipase L1-like esterase
MDRSLIYTKWNEALAETVREFASEDAKEITAMIYSAYDTFTRVLDDPLSHGFALEDVEREEGGIWYDRLHPTSAMHGIIARDVARFLGDQPAFVEE